MLAALVFGVGWGLAGICPGPALVLAGTGSAKASSSRLYDRRQRDIRILEKRKRVAPGPRKCDHRSSPWRRRIPSANPDSSAPREAHAAEGQARTRGSCLPSAGSTRFRPKPRKCARGSSAKASCARRLQRSARKESPHLRDPAIDRVEPTPFQRDLSQAHHRKLADVLDRTGMFLDPVIAVTAPDKGFWTPNGPASSRSDAKAGRPLYYGAYPCPKREIAWQILALNTEKRTTCAKSRSK